jgi:purine-binding chemotaxis protein CheW
MAELLLIVRLAGRRVALPAADVEAVVELEGITPAPRSAPHVAGLSSLRSRVLTVIDGLASLEIGDGPAEGQLEAIVVPSGGHTYAILVEAVEDVIEAARPSAPVRTQVGAGWERVASGMVETGGDLLLLVDPHALIAGPAAPRAA